MAGVISIHALHEESDWIRERRHDSQYISIHALHEESDHCTHPHQCPRSEFQSTLSMRRATGRARNRCVPTGFQSTLSMRRATFPSFFGREVTKFQSTLSMRRATTDRTTRLPSGIVISIHALHEESDLAWRAENHRRNISIHALHEESDLDHRHET